VISAIQRLGLRELFFFFFWCRSFVQMNDLLQIGNEQLEEIIG